MVEQGGPGGPISGETDGEPGVDVHASAEGAEVVSEQGSAGVVGGEPYDEFKIWDDVEKAWSRAADAAD